MPHYQNGLKGIDFLTAPLHFKEHQTMHSEKSIFRQTEIETEIAAFFNWAVELQFFKFSEYMLCMKAKRKLEMIWDEIETKLSN